jgi:hypothetical protein
MLIKNLEVKIIPSYPEYAATACGRIFRISTKHEMKIIEKVRDGRSRRVLGTRLSIDGKLKNALIHRLVCEAWWGSSDGLRNQVNHKDGNPLNNHKDNLEWVTGSENQRHAIASGLKQKGEKLYNAALSDEQVHNICSKLANGALPRDLAKEYGVSKDIIRKIRAGDTYFHVRVLYDIPHKYKEFFSEATIKWVCSKIIEGLSDKGIVEVSTNPKLTVIEIKRIRYKIRYKHISDLYF